MVTAIVKSKLMIRFPKKYFFDLLAGGDRSGIFYMGPVVEHFVPAQYFKTRSSNT